MQTQSRNQAKTVRRFAPCRGIAIDLSTRGTAVQGLIDKWGCGLFIGHYRLKPLDDAPQSLNHRT
ncbi:hypothetical protein ACRQEJ_09935, partial [Actinotignum sp. GS-2025b]|uniref:hypothetical protein n=1 Tax=Actinotignum sp. GS-2025b TaxID=3427275 RepID=UPI003F46E364